MEKIKTIGLVIPTYKQEKTIISNLAQLEDTLLQLPYVFHLYVVVDGFYDKSYQLLKELKKKNITVLGYEQNKGKGFAVRYGMLHAKEDVIGFIDGDLDIDPMGIDMLINHMIWYEADIVVGSKLHPVSLVKYPVWRKVLSWGYRTFIRLLFGLRVRDTQVGIKFFKKVVVQDVFPRLLVKRFAFDIEMLAVAYDRGFKRIYEAPIKLKFHNMSTITSKSLWNVIYRMLLDTVAVFYRLRILHYYDKKESIHTP